MKRRWLPLLLLLFVPDADASTVTAERAVARDCVSRLLPARAPGVVRRTHDPVRSGLLTVRLTAARGDWDLAVFDARTGARRAASASFGPRETVTVRSAPLVVQACRRSGSARAQIRYRVHPLPELPLGRVQLLRVRLLDPGEHRRLEATGLDVTHNSDGQSVDVVTYSAAERVRLLRAGFTWDVKIADLAAHTRRAARRPGIARIAQADGLPSGRTAYRTLADYSADLKKLVEEHKDIAGHVEIGRSLEDRPIEGVELAAGVARTDDGRPTFAVFGLHHAREWPSGEMPMEFALDLARSYGTDPRITAILNNVRVLILPVINPDGFEVSRSSPELNLIEAGAYKRKNCRPNQGSEDLPCLLRLTQGVDLNRNYGAYWGGVGSSASTTASNYRGPAPFSEPESEAVHKLSQTRNIVTVISHHTYTADGVWLRPPGFCSVPPDGCQPDVDIVPDEAGMRRLGDRMGAASGWLSQLGWAIGEITGATEDWNYFATGAYGYTPEQRGSNFHPAYADAVIGEYLGKRPEAMGGVREALLRAAEQARDPQWHSVIEGKAIPGHRLRLTRTFTTPTLVDGVKVDDKVDLVLDVPADGSFRWHVNPSTRPLATEPELYTVTCESPSGEVKQTKTLLAERGTTTTLYMGCGEEDPEPKPEPEPTPAPTPTPEPTPEPTPVVTPEPVRPAPRMTLTRGVMSANVVNHRRWFRLAVRLDGGLVRELVARLVDRRGRTFAAAEAAQLEGDARLILRRVRKLRRGRYVAWVVGVDARGRRVRASVPVRVKARGPLPRSEALRRSVLRG